MNTGIVYSFEEGLYKIGETLYKKAESPSESTITVAVISPIDIYPENDEGVTVNNMGHFEGKIENIERYQEEKLNKTIRAANNLGTLLKKVEPMYLYPYDAEKISKRTTSGDHLICSKQAVSRLAGEEFSNTYDYFVFEMYKDSKYVGKNVIENWPFMLLLEATYHDLVTYLQSLDLYEKRWPFTHVWQNGIEFAQMAQVIATERFRIWSLGYFQSFNSLYVRDEVMPLLSENDHILVTDWGSVFPASALLIAKARFPKNIFWCANGEEEKKSLVSMGIQAHVVSHNAFINDKVFISKRYAKKNFSAIFNQSLIPFKRPNLAKSLDHVVYTSGSNPSKEYERMITEQPGSEIKINSSPYEIAELINRSHCGLAFSQAEGGNYATTEYLLCGIPVISTKNIGGRDVYLDESNSVYCDDTPESVLDAVRYVINNPGKFDPDAIRKGALAKNAQMISRLKREILGPIIRKYFPVDDKQIDDIVEKIRSVDNPNSKGRTVLQPEFSIVTIK